MKRKSPAGDQQNFAGSMIKILITFGIRDQTFGQKYGISDKKYISLRTWSMHKGSDNQFLMTSWSTCVNVAPQDHQV